MQEAARVLEASRVILKEQLPVLGQVLPRMRVQHQNFVPSRERETGT
jgi:hypothetical protein